jgi:hypothetical protein
MKSAFSESHQELMTVAFFLASQCGALSFCSFWAKSHLTDLATSLNSQRISESLAAVSNDRKQTFFAKWMLKLMAEDDLCYDHLDLFLLGAERVRQVRL